MKVDQPALPDPAKDDRKTTDLCGHERLGARCMRRHGHDGRHECVYWRGNEALEWD